jgi:DNA-3-methyladenine glycosylase
VRRRGRDPTGSHAAREPHPGAAIVSGVQHDPAECVLQGDEGPPPYGLAFYARPADLVARALLGSVLRVVGHDGVTRGGRIVETEAYVGAHDLACHAAKGRTRRTEVMFGPAGHAYIYLVYGLHELFNVVTGPEGDPQAVLVRALEPAPGTRGPDGGERGDGPGRLTRLLGIDRRLLGAPLDAPPLTLHPGRVPSRVVATRRIGVAYAGPEWADARLRFVDADSAQLSVSLARSGSGNSSRGRRDPSRTPST